jgi:hypothetical protein
MKLHELGGLFIKKINQFKLTLSKKYMTYGRKYWIFRKKMLKGVKYLPSIQFVHLRKIKMYFYLWFFDRQNLSEVSHK